MVKGSGAGSSGGDGGGGGSGRTGGGGRTPRRSIRQRLREAGLEGAARGEEQNQAPFRYPTARLAIIPTILSLLGRAGGTSDRFGNEWVPGPYHGDPKLNHHMEWDVQLTPEGQRHWDKFEDASDARGGGKIPERAADGYLSH